MPYPDANAYAITTPSTSLDPRSNGLPGFIGNAHTGRATANGLAGLAMPPFAGWSTTWTGVTFDGATDILQNPTNLGLGATSDTFTAAFAFNITTAQTNTLLWGTVADGIWRVQISSGGSIVLDAMDGSTWGFTTVASGNGTVVPGADYICHIAAQASTNTVRMWLNGVERTLSAGFWFSTAPFGRPTAWAVGGIPSSTLLAGKLGLAWFDVGQYIVDPTKFAPAYALGAQLANPGARPAIGFGGVQTVANWNAGTNLGDGTGTWTMTGAVT
jgi:hypothetical protein